MYTKIITILILALAIFSCAKDDSTGLLPNNNPDFSVIKISSDVETVSVDNGDLLDFEPTVSQRIEDTELEYLWTIAEAFGSSTGDTVRISNEKHLKYICKKEGVFLLRLEVKNKFYSEFAQWELHVREQDRGIFVASIEEDGRSSVAFARSLSETDILNGITDVRFISNIIQNINPEVEIRDIVSIVKSEYERGTDGGYVYIICKDKIHVAHETRFQIILTVNVDDYFPGERIKKVTGVDYPNSDIYLFTESGKSFFMNKKEFILYSSRILEGTYDDVYPNIQDVYYGEILASQTYLNYEESRIYNISPYSGIYDITTAPVIRDLLSKYNIKSIAKMNGNYYAGQSNLMFAVGTGRDNPDKVLITAISNGRIIKVLEYETENPIFPEKETMCPNAKYDKLYFAKGNKVYAWTSFAAGNVKELPTYAAIELEEGKEVTCIRTSVDRQEVYVGYYDTNSSEEYKGGVYVYDASKVGFNEMPTPIRKYENIAYRPIEIIYKELGQLRLK